MTVKIISSDERIKELESEYLEMKGISISREANECQMILFLALSFTFS